MYWLDTEAVLSVSTPEGFPETDRWQAPAHAGCLRPALILLAGESVEFAVDAGAAGCQVFLSFCAGLPEISIDGLEVELGWSSEAGFDPIVRLPLKRGEEFVERGVRLDLPPSVRLPAKLGLRCLPGPAGDPCADWLAVRELVVADEACLSLARARAFGTLRAANERAHFAQAYCHPMYVERFTRASSIDALIPSRRSLLVPDGCSNAFDLGHAWLGEQGGEDVPDFARRLRDMAARLGRPVRMASMCAGAGATEAALLRGAGVPAEMTLVDIDESLLATAASRNWGNVRLQTLQLDVNRLKLPHAAFDVILCVSGAHHLVELEHVFATVGSALSPGGELWLIGEQIGLVGNRLDPLALEAANRIFSALPARYRINQRTGEADPNLPNFDCSEATFEGIRSADIEAVVQRRFRPVQTCRRNVFLWRVVGPDYVLNYDISAEADRQILADLVQADIASLRAGMRPTELHGVYRPIV